MVTSISLEKLYSNLDKHIKLTSSFTDKSEVSKIITMCRLKPYSLLSDYSEKIVLHYHWVDEFGNSFFIRKNKKIQIVLNDLHIDRSKIVSTDLYKLLPIEKVSAISKLVYILIGKEEDYDSDHIILVFLGIDGFLRTFVYIYDEWHNYSPLTLGMDVLSEIANNLDLKFYKEYKKSKNVIYPCSSQKSWLTFWPCSSNFTSIIREQNESVLHLLNVNKGK